MDSEDDEAEAARPPTSPGAQAFRDLLNRVPSWAFLAGLGGFIALLTLLSWLNKPLFYDGFVDKYLWRPIVEDSGYNPFNTILLMVVLAFILGWLYRLLDEWKETVDFELSLGVLPYLVWGSLFRVLEDSDLFSPFNENLEAAGLAGGRSCAPELGAGFANCFGVLFITPLIYVWITFIAVFFLWVGRLARRVSERTGRRQGLRFVALAFLGVLLLASAAWAAGLGVARFLPNPLVVLAGCLVAFGVVWRTTPPDGHVNPRWVMFGASLIFLVVGAWYVGVFMLGGREGWGPDGPTHAWILIGMLAAPTLLAWGVARTSRALARPPPGAVIPVRTRDRPHRLFAALAVVTVLEALLVFASLVAVQRLTEQAPGWRSVAFWLGVAALGPLAVYAGARWFRRKGPYVLGVHPGLAWFALPINLVMFWGQTVDAVTSSLGIDVFGYSPKQVVPRTLRGLIEGLNLPRPLDGYSTTLGLIPVKILIVLGVVWLIDVARKPGDVRQENLIGLVKLAITMVGVSPGVRDGVRLAMGT